MSSIYYVKWITSYPSYFEDEWEELYGVSLHETREKADAFIKYEEGFCGTDCYKKALTYPEKVELNEEDEEIYKTLKAQESTTYFDEVEDFSEALRKFCDNNDINCDYHKYDFK